MSDFRDSARIFTQTTAVTSTREPWGQNLDHFTKPGCRFQVNIMTNHKAIAFPTRMIAPSDKNLVGSRLQIVAKFDKLNPVENELAIMSSPVEG